MNAKQKTKLRVGQKLGRGFCSASCRTLGEGQEVRGKLKRTSRRFTAHVSSGVAWRLGGPK